MSVKVTVVDEQTGDREEAIVPDGDYLIICTAPAWVHHVQAHANGTHVLTVKGRKGGLNVVDQAPKAVRLG